MIELVKDLLKYSPSRLVPAIVGVVSIPVLTRMFPPSIYGDYRLVVATVALLGPTIGWLNWAVLRYYPEFDLGGQLGTLYTTVGRLHVYTTAAFVVFTTGFLVFARGAISQDLRSLIVVGLVLIVVNMTYSVVASLLRSRREATWYSFSQSLRSVLDVAIGLLVVVVLGTGIAGFLWGSVIGGVLIVPLMWWRAARRVNISWRNKLDRPLARTLFRYASPLLLAQSASWLLQFSDRYLLGLFRGNTEVGIYAASYGIADTSIGMILGLFQMSFIVLANRVFEKSGKTAAAEFVEQAVRVYFMVSIPAVVGVSVLGESIISVMTGPEYSDGYRIIPLVSVATLFSGLAFWHRFGFMLYKRTELSLLSIAMAAAVNVSLNLLLVPRYGYVAAAATTLIAFITLDLASWWLSRRLFVWRIPKASLLKSLLASGAMGAAVWAFDRVSSLPDVLNLIVGIGIGVVVAASLLVAMGEINRHDLAQLRAALAGEPNIPDDQL